MPDNTLSSIDFERFFRILDKLVPEASSFSICNCNGECSTADVAHDDTSDDGESGENEAESRQTGTASHATSCLMTLGDSSARKVPINNRMGDTVGFLLAEFTPGCVTPENEDDITDRLTKVSDCLQQEYLLTRELNTMARELTGRYEELNLVYDTRDEVTDISQHDDLLQSVVKNCVVYLDVDMVALILPHQQKHFHAINRNNHVEDPDDLVEKLSAKLLNHFKENDEHIILNDVNSTQHQKICPEIPYKILATSILDAGNNAIGMLACLNQNDRPDFFNSGRSVLDVMSKKVSKIIMSNYDALTGLLSSRSFESVVASSLNAIRLTGISSCLLNIDIDQLKIINDSYGREAGDEVIRKLGEHVKSEIRNSDTIAYLGEGRFGVLIDKCTISQGITLAETLRDTIEQAEIFWKTKPVNLSASIGLAVLDPGIPDVDSALEAAELARDTAKESGRNRIQVYHHGDKDIMLRKGQMRWVNRIQNALRDERFVIYCQKIHPLKKSNEAYHFEILLRMIDEQDNIVSPDDFIAPAEQYHLMPMIDRWLISNTFSTLARHGLALTPNEGRVSINLCGQSMTERGLVDWISKQMHQHGIEPSCLCFEVTETAAVRNIEAARHIIRELCKIGCRFSLDDFGTGMSSFAYLKELPVNYLKIDGSFVRRITDDQVAHAMVTSINDIGHVMGLETIAEYVENEAVLRKISEIGTDYVQGYEIMKPAPLEDYLATCLKGSNSLKTG